MTYQEFIDEWNNSLPTIHVHTSGSTGKPKSMVVEKQRMVNSAKMTCNFLQLKEGDTALLCMSLNYIGAKMMVVRSLVQHLRLIQVEPSGHPLATVNTPLTFAAMVPLQVYNSLQVPEEREKLRQIQHLIIGGGAINDDLATQLYNFPHSVWSTYGMTETLSHIALRRINGSHSDLWYTPLQGIDISLNKEHCLIIHAPHLHSTPIITNDIAEMHTNNCNQLQFRIIGRRDNTINTGGVKVQIEEVERLLHPHLTLPFMITKAPDSKFGEIVVILIETQYPPKQQSSIFSSIRSICQQALPKYWQPRQYVATPHLPMTGNGKPDRAQAQIIIHNCTKRIFI